MIEEKTRDMLEKNDKKKLHKRLTYQKSLLLILKQNLKFSIRKLLIFLNKLQILLLDKSKQLSNMNQVAVDPRWRNALDQEREPITVNFLRPNLSQLMNKIQYLKHLVPLLSQGQSIEKKLVKRKKQRFTSMRQMLSLKNQSCLF